MALNDNDKPAQYILGGTDFCGLWFKVTSDTLIPRPETELLVEYIIQRYKNKDVRIIDLGTGCGNIAITLAKKLGAKIYAVDISIKALMVAMENAKRHNVLDNIEFFCSDWFGGLDIAPVDIIAGNPPYVAKEEWPLLPSNVKNYEPRIALWGGEKGLDHYKVILFDVFRFLKFGGELVLEIGWNQGRLVRDMASGIGIFHNVDIKKDQADLDRILIAQKNGALHKTSIA